MRRIIVLLALVALVLAACGGSDENGVASIDNEPNNAEQDSSGDPMASEEETLLEFAACMRDNGVEDFEDPFVNPDGSVEFGFAGGGGAADPLADVDADVLEAAFEACSDALLGLAFGSDGRFDLVAFQDTLLEFAQCMRDNGVDVDDPSLADFAPGNQDSGGFGGPFGDLDIGDPEVRAAFEACQPIFTGFGTFGGDS
jgi:hypothetical protein